MLRIFVGTGSDKDDTCQVIAVDYNNSATSYRTISIPESEIMSMLQLSDTLLLVGCLHGAIYTVYLEGEALYSKLFEVPGDAILSMAHVNLDPQGEMVFIGMGGIPAAGTSAGQVLVAF